MANRTKNTLIDLNDHLFLQMERLDDDDLKEDDLADEIKRASAMSKIAQQIINNAELVLDAAKLNNNFENRGTVPRILIGSESKKGDDGE